MKILGGGLCSVSSSSLVVCHSELLNASLLFRSSAYTSMDLHVL